jgi:hypothetical protein
MVRDRFRIVGTVGRLKSTLKSLCQKLTLLSCVKQRETGAELRFGLWFHGSSCQVLEREKGEPKIYVQSDQACSKKLLFEPEKEIKATSGLRVLSRSYSSYLGQKHIGASMKSTARSVKIARSKLDQYPKIWVDPKSSKIPSLLRRKYTPRVRRRLSLLSRGRPFQADMVEAEEHASEDL